MILNFTHISKTAGSSIEDCAFDKQVFWGRHDLELWKEMSKYSNLNVIDPWHIPISFCQNDRLKHKILKKYSFFTVVRNPYERCVSEFFCKWNKKTKTNINEFIKTKLKEVEKLNFEYNAHFIPQHFYVYDKNKQYVDNVLYFENIETQFDNLMKKHKLNITLNKKINTSIKNIYVKDLKLDTIKLIAKIYAEDFHKFGYSFDIKKTKLIQIKLI
jgi:hypothetical protein